MNGYRGYVFSRPFQGQRVPQHVQNLVIRDYCQRHHLPFLLSATEYAIPSSHLMLSKLISELDQIQGIVAYSLFQLPEKTTHRQAILQRILDAKKSIHFSQENLSIQTPSDQSRVEAIWQVNRVLPNCLQTLSR